MSTARKDDAYERDILAGRAARQKRIESDSAPGGTVLSGDERYHYQYVGEASPARRAAMEAKGYVQCAPDEVVAKAGYHGPATHYWRKPKLVVEEDRELRDAQINGARRRLGLSRAN